MEFAWDETKAAANERKHDFSFNEAMTIFGDTRSMTGYDPQHADDEDRYITRGFSTLGRTLLVSHTDRGEIIRIISARVASRRERKDYQDGNLP